ncbi:NDR1/HIN1-like protein 2 [Linum perenne]
MQALPSPPPQSQLQSIPEKEAASAVSLNQIVISKHARGHQGSTAGELVPFSETKLLTGTQPILHPLRPRKTNPLVWFGAILCLIFSLVLIFLAIATLITYFVVRPEHPAFDVQNARLNGIYFDSPEFFNGDISYITNFTNLNKKMDVRFEYVGIKVYFGNKLIGAQAIQPFTQRPREMTFKTVRFISSLVYLPQSSAVELQKQVLSNKVTYNIRATIKLKANLGLFHYTYWLHGKCDTVFSAPPAGVLVFRSCNTNR